MGRPPRIQSSHKESQGSSGTNLEKGEAKERQMQLSSLNYMRDHAIQSSPVTLTIAQAW